MGDNECDQFIHDDPYGRNPNFNRLTREVLPDVVAIEDPSRSYIPSSPYIDPEAAKLPQAYLTENHLWGPRDYYKSKFYKDSLAHFASEKGHCGEAKSFTVDKLQYSQGEKKIYLIEWEAGQLSGKNHYLAGNPPFALSHYAAFVKEVYGEWFKESQKGSNMD